MVKYLTVYTGVLFSLLYGNAEAAGFQIKEQGGDLQGLSFAGATAKADGLSTLFFNPAGAVRLEGGQAEVHGGVIAMSSDIQLTSVTPALAGGAEPALANGNGGNIAEPAFVPSFYALWDIDLAQDSKFGVAINAPFGLATGYDDGWAGRYYALDSELKTINVQPTFATRLTDKLSVGGGVQMQYASAHLTRAINSAVITSGVITADGKSVLEGDDIAFGYTLGFLYEASENTRFGVSYRSEVEHTLKGDLDIQGLPAGLSPALEDADAEADLTTPSVLSFGAYHALNDRWAIMGEVAKTGWSSFDRLTVKNQADGLIREDIDENWNDSMFYAVGVEYTPDDINTFQFGVAYDQTPVSDNHRTFRIPDADRTWVSAGYQRNLGARQKLSIGYSYIMAKDAPVTENADAALGGIVSGRYEDARVHVLSASYSFKF